MLLPARSVAGCFIEVKHVPYDLLQEGTSKVLAAQKRKNVHVVWTRWLLESMGQWQRQNEQDYLLSSSAQDKNRTEALSEGWPHASTSSPNSPSTDEGKKSIPLSSEEVAPSEANVSQDSGVNEMPDEEQGDALDVDWDNMDAELDAYLEENGMSPL